MLHECIDTKKHIFFMLRECIDTKKHIFFMLRECIDTKKHIFLCCMNALIQRNTSFLCCMNALIQRNTTSFLCCINASIQRNMSFYAAWMHWYKETYLFMLHECIDTTKHIFLCCMHASSLWLSAIHWLFLLLFFAFRSQTWQIFIISCPNLHLFTRQVFPLKSSPLHNWILPDSFCYEAGIPT